MSFKTNHITDKFKRTFFCARSLAEYHRAQELMFKMGFKWASGCRKKYDYSGGISRLEVCEDNRITNNPYNYAAFGDREITMYDLRQAADQVVAIRKAKKKDQRKRKALTRAGWINVTQWGNVPVGEPINVVFPDGSVLNNWTYATSFNPAVYPLPSRVQRVQKTVSLQDMVADIVEKAGGTEVRTSHVDKDGFIRWTGGVRPVAADTMVNVRFSDGVVSTPTAAGDMYWEWKYKGKVGDIVAYRVCPVVTNPCADVVKAVTESAQPDTNPKRQYGLASVPLNLWSPLASAYGAVSLYNGSLKYGRGNYKATPVEASIYIAAALRHLMAWSEGEEFDPADGCPNLGGVLANIAILLDARACGTLIDDRQIPSGYLKEREMLKELVKKLQEVHAGKDPRHYTIADAK